MFNFDEVIDRKNTSSMKWGEDALELNFQNKEALPLWVADMDFKVSPAITEEIQKVVDHGIYGYSNSGKANEALVEWTERKHGWTINHDWIINTPGIVFALNTAVKTFTKPGDSVIIQRPVYYPFTDCIVKNGRHVSSNSLIINGTDISIDFEDFEARAQDPNTSLFILCSPHNPLSKIFSKEDIKRMLDICRENDVVVISDEIHNDLIMPGSTFTSVGELGEEYLDNVIICLAPSKTFNLAGMQWSAVIIPNEKLYQPFARSIEQQGVGLYNPISFAATIGAFNGGSDQWLEEVIDYIYENYKYLKERLTKELNGVQVFNLEATYLAFVDFSNLGFTVEELEDKIFRQANVGLDGGDWFGPEGEGSMRFNLACPRTTLEEALTRIIKVLSNQ